MESDLDPVVAVVADDVVLDDCCGGSVQIDSIVAIVFESIAATDATTAFIIDSIPISGEPVI